MTPMRQEAELVTEQHDVALVDLPVSLFLETQQHHDTVLRELALVALAPEADSSTPNRLRTLAREAHSGFGDAPKPFRDAVAAAAARGDDIVTLRLSVPDSTLRFMEDFLLVFDEADEFSRRGELLTPPSAPGVAAFRRWFVGELMRQVRDGAPPSPFWA